LVEEKEVEIEKLKKQNKEKDLQIENLLKEQD